MLFTKFDISIVIKDLRLKLTIIILNEATCMPCYLPNFRLAVVATKCQHVVSNRLFNPCRYD